eukprot:364321-Chlamydomonas_euryale.AAC.13
MRSRAAAPQPHCSHTTATPQPHRSHTAATPRPHRGHTAATPQPHHSRTAATPRPHRSHTTAAPQPHRGHTAAAPQPHRSHTAAAPQPHRGHNAATPQPHRSHTAATPWPHRGHTATTLLPHRSHTAATHVCTCHMQARQRTDSEFALAAVAYVRAHWPWWDARGGGGRHLVVATGDFGKLELSLEAQSALQNVRCGQRCRAQKLEPLLEGSARCEPCSTACTPVASDAGHAERRGGGVRRGGG